MGRVIKLFIYYLLYTFAFTGIFSGGYMIANHTLEFPQSDATVFQLTMWAQVLSTLAVGVHLLVWKYVKRDQLSLSFPNAGKVMLASIILIVGMGCWTNYLTELTGLPDTMEEIFTKAMYNPLGVISIVVMAPIVEELLFRGGMQGHLLRNGRIPPGRFWCLPLSSVSYMAIPCKCFSLPSWDWYWAGYITAPEACCPAC